MKKEFLLSTLLISNLSPAMAELSFTDLDKAHLMAHIKGGETNLKYLAFLSEDGIIHHDKNDAWVKKFDGQPIYLKIIFKDVDESISDPDKMGLAYEVMTTFVTASGETIYQDSENIYAAKMIKRRGRKAYYKLYFCSSTSVCTKEDNYIQFQIWKSHEQLHLKVTKSINIDSENESLNAFSISSHLTKGKNFFLSFSSPE